MQTDFYVTGITQKNIKDNATVRMSAATGRGRCIVRM